MSKIFAPVVAAVAVASNASAAPVTSQNSSVSFAGAFLDGIVGNGIENSNFEVSTNAAEGIEIGLNAIERFVGNIPTVGGDTYIAEAGESDPGLATWNYVLVADLGSRTIADFDIELAIDFDPAGSSSTVIVDVDAAALAGGYSGLSQFGDSQNLGFEFWSVLGAPAFDPFANGEYDITFSVFEKGTSNVYAQSDITVQVVPAPGVACVLGLAGVTARRRRR